MDKKEIVIDILNDGSINAETFGFNGVGCVEELNKLMKSLATTIEVDKKPDYYNNEIKTDNVVKVKNG